MTQIDFKKCHYIFDLDGTLIDSLGDITLALNETLRQHGFEEVSAEYIEPLIGRPAQDLFSHLHDTASDSAQMVVEFRKNLYETCGNESRLYPGVEHGIQQINSLGHVTSIATNKPSYLARRVLERAGLVNYFSHIAGTESLRPKPHPDTILDCTQHHPETETWMIGDTTFDVEAGKTAGIKTIAVASGSHLKAKLSAAEPDLLFESFQDFATSIGFLQ